MMWREENFCGVNKFSFFSFSVITEPIEVLRSAYSFVNTIVIALNTMTLSSSSIVLIIDRRLLRSKCSFVSLFREFKIDGTFILCQLSAPSALNSWSY
uniref:Ovule protein n=1 Tax=Strongyloides venezuelensis TaxID=75913 RepID=A0A0K0G5Z1_STRVS